MPPRKNHPLEALGVIRDLVEGFPDDVDTAGDRYDDGASHSKQEARAVAQNTIDAMITDLQELRGQLTSKYTR